ncbi:MAG TPA: hypothetical protein VGG28_27715 [Kofleriaceae bacterium]
MRRFALAFVLAGCFGEGPVPPTASDAPIVFAAPVPTDSSLTCTNSSYVTSIAFGSDSGYAVLFPYGPQLESCGTVTANATVMAFPIDGSAPDGHMIGTAGMSTQGIPTPQLALGSNGPLWVFDTPGQPTVTNVAEPGGSPLVIATGSGTTLGFLAGVAGDNVATSNGVQASDPMSPNYPCCTSGNGQQTPAGELTGFTIAGTQITATPPATLSALSLGELASAIAASSQAIYFIEPKTSMFGIEAVTPTATTELATIAQPATGAIPVGLVADDTHVAWAFAQDAQATPLKPGCAIWATTAGGSNLAPLFTSTNLSCMGLAIDPDAVYFAIVEDRQEANCSGCSPYLHGVGIGRVDFQMHVFSSIAFDVAAIASGPRRVFTSPGDPNDLFVADPLAIAKVAKTAFGGRQDIAP